MLVSRHADLLEHARLYRNYGKPDHAVPGLNFRMSEFTAAIGLVQAERLDEIVAWKNDVARRRLDPLHPGRLRLPDGMVSGLYKYIVFDPVERSTGGCTTSPATASSGPPSTCPTATGSPRTTGACRCTTGPERTSRAPAARPGAQPGRGDRLQHERQRRHGGAPRPRRAVVVSVVEQQHVPRRELRVRPPRRRRAAWRRPRQSRPQRDHSSGVHPRRRTARSAAGE